MKQTICDNCKNVIPPGEDVNPDRSTEVFIAGKSIKIIVQTEGAVDICADCIFRELHDWACKETTIIHAAPSS